MKTNKLRQFTYNVNTTNHWVFIYGKECKLDLDILKSDQGQGHAAKEVVAREIAVN